MSDDHRHAPPEERRLEAMAFGSVTPVPGLVDQKTQQPFRTCRTPFGESPKKGTSSTCPSDALKTSFATVIVFNRQHQATTEMMTATATAAATTQGRERQRQQQRRQRQQGQRKRCERETAVIMCNAPNSRNFKRQTLAKYGKLQHSPQQNNYNNSSTQQDNRNATTNLSALSSMTIVTRRLTVKPMLIGTRRWHDSFSNFLNLKAHASSHDAIRFML